MRRYGVFALLFFYPASLVPAQESRSSIIGAVTDSSGAAIAGAKVRAINPETNTGGESRSNDEGNFEIPLLQPGVYRVTVEKDGFKRAARTDVQLGVDVRQAADFVLEIGDLSQTVTVTAEAPLVDATSPTVGLVIDERQVSELPIAGGNAFYLTRLSPGINATGGHSPGNPFDQGHASGDIIVNGTRSGSSEVALDGASNMSGTSAIYAPPQDLVQEFKIQTLAFDASVGHGTGAVVNVSIKSGTNQLHGSSYFFDSRLRATPWFVNNWLYNPSTGPVTEEKRREGANEGWLHQRWGTTGGGPVTIPKLYNGRNRTFWVFGFEGMYVRRTPTIRATVPTIKQRNGDFSDLLALGSRYQIYDPATGVENTNGQYRRQPLPDNIIPPGRVNPVSRNIMNYWPLPNAQGTVDDRNNYFRVYDEDKDYLSLLGRIDHAFNQNHRAFLRLNFARYDTTLQTLPTIALGNITSRNSWGAVLDDIVVLGPNSILNLRWGFTYQNPNTSRYSQGFDLLSLGFPQSLVSELKRKADPAGIAFPNITVANYTALGADGGNSSTTAYHAWSGTYTRLVRGHSLRMGGEFRLMRENGYNYGDVSPSLDFQTNWTRGPNSNSGSSPIGQGLASLLLGLPTGGQVNVNASRAEQSTFTALYIQDDWRAGRKLTVNAGVRWEYESATTERYDRSIRGFDFAVPSPVEAEARAAYALAPIPQIAPEDFRLPGGLTFPGVNGLPRSLWKPDPNNFAPRIGLAYQLRRGTVLRTGYGIFFGLMGIDRQDVKQGGFNQVTQLVSSIDGGLTFTGTLSDPFPDGIKEQTGSGAGLRTFLGQGANFFYATPLNSYMQRWTFSIQHQVLPRMVLETTYVGNRGTKLNASVQYNPVPREYLSQSAIRDQAAIDLLGGQVRNPFAGIPDFAGTSISGLRVARSQLLRPHPQFTGVTANEPLGYSWYHAFQTRVQKRFGRGAALNFAYTWSKFMEATSFLNGTDPRPEEVVSDQDYPHRVIFGGIYDLPFGRGRRFMRSTRGWRQWMFGGWQVQGWYEGQTGQALGFGNAIFRGDLHDIPIPRPERQISRWFNVDAGFERASGQQLGNNIRTLSTRFNGVRGDGLNNLDGSLFKVFNPRERWRVQFRAEAYNALNHAQFANPDTTPTSSAFGTVTAEKGHGQRQLTFAVKLMF